MGELVGIVVEFGAIVGASVGDEEITQVGSVGLHRDLTVQLGGIVVGREHTADTGLVEGGQLALAVRNVRMLVVAASIGGDGKGSIQRTGTYDMVAHPHWAVVHRTFLAGRVKEVDQLARTGRDTTQVAHIAGQAQRLLLHGVVGEEEFAVVVVKRQRGAVHLGMQQRTTDLHTAIDTHTVEVVFVLAKRVTRDREYIAIA